MSQAVLEAIDEIEKIIREYRDSIGKDPQELAVFKTLDRESRQEARSEWNGSKLACDAIIARIRRYAEGLVK
jgi:hypothetical protein